MVKNMNNIHISTRETFMLDAFTLDGYCPVCCSSSKISIGYVECRCFGCGSYFSLDSSGSIVKARRELLKLTIKQMADIAGITKSTIKEYEKYGSSRKYYRLTSDLINKHFNREDPDE